jgi:hypothetical protein
MGGVGREEGVYIGRLCLLLWDIRRGSSWRFVGVVGHSCGTGCALAHGLLTSLLIVPPLIRQSRAHRAPGLGRAGTSPAVTGGPYVRSALGHSTRFTVLALPPCKRAVLLGGIGWHLSAKPGQPFFSETLILRGRCKRISGRLESHYPWAMAAAELRRSYQVGIRGRAHSPRFVRSLCLMGSHSHHRQTSR